MNILFVNACVRGEKSRTLRLCYAPGFLRISHELDMRMAGANLCVRPNDALGLSVIIG